MVTPPDKTGASIGIGFALTPPSIAQDGTRVLSKSIQCFHAPPSCVGVRLTEGEPFAFQRAETGWATQALAPPASAAHTMLAYNADTGLVLYALAASPPALEEFYARTPDGTLHSIGPLGESPGIQIGSADVAGLQRATSSDLTRVVYQGELLWPSLEGGAKGTLVLEYSGTGNHKPTLVGVTGPAGSTSLISACGTRLGGSEAVHNGYGTLSSDGRTVLFTATPCAEGTGANTGVKVPAFDLYARIEQAGGMGTVLVSGSGIESECDAACRSQPPGDASYQGASSDGTHVYFTSTRQLTNTASEDKHPGDTASGGGCSILASIHSGCNLYEFACPAHCETPADRRLVDVSAGDSSGRGPQVQGVIAIPSNGSDVYFVARGVLTQGANRAGREPAPGRENLYVYRSGSEGNPPQLSFIATLAVSDATQWTKFEGIGVANVTPDGRYLVFTSHKALTPDVSRETGSAQVYRYDVEAEALARVSVGERGYNDNGNTSTVDASIVEARKGFSIGDGPGRADPTMSDNGGLVFFQSPVGLTPGALNNQHVTGNPKLLAENVYEWAADGAGLPGGEVACEQPAGCVSLISDGRDVVEGSQGKPSTTELLGSDTTGQNVFFRTADQLVPGDTDTQVDFYDARVGGGFPAAAFAVPCEGQGCREPPSIPSIFSPLPSETLMGAGNLVSQPPATHRAETLTSHQRLARALAACRKTFRARSKRLKRTACEKQARRRYGPKRGAVHTSHRTRRAGRR
jgi:hypothetical protein